MIPFPAVIYLLNFVGVCFFDSAGGVVTPCHPSIIADLDGSFCIFMFLLFKPFDSGAQLCLWWRLAINVDGLSVNCVQPDFPDGH